MAHRHVEDLNKKDYNYAMVFLYGRDKPLYIDPENNPIIKEGDGYASIQHEKVVVDQRQNPNSTTEKPLPPIPIWGRNKSIFHLDDISNIDYVYVNKQQPKDYATPEKPTLLSAAGLPVSSEALTGDTKSDEQPPLAIETIPVDTFHIEAE